MYLYRYVCTDVVGTLKVGRIHENTERLYHIVCVCVCFVYIYSLLIQKKILCDIIRIDGSFAFAFFSSFILWYTFQANSLHHIPIHIGTFFYSDRALRCVFSYNQRNYISWQQRHTKREYRTRENVLEMCLMIYI